MDSQAQNSEEIKALEERYGPVMAQYIMDQLHRTECMDAANAQRYARAA